MAANQFNRGIGIGFTLLFESQIFPFMLSSAFTCRTIVQEKDYLAAGWTIDFGAFTAAPTVTVIGL